MHSLGARLVWYNRRMANHRSAVAGIALALSLAASPSADAATCVKLSSDIGSGSTGSAVLSLQAFLKEAGYLSAAPNGNFGPATLAAAKAFQAAKGIAATGFVGPQTRLAVQAASCGSTGTASSGTAANAGASAAGKASFVSDLSGAQLELGDTYKVSWTAPKASDLMLVVEDADGVNKGSVSGYLGAAQSYEWQVGLVSVAGSDSQSALAPGNYRFRLQGRMDGKLQSDPVTSYFTVVAPSISISHIYPTTLPADGRTPGVLYGTGFTAGITGYLDDDRDKALKLLYASADAKVMVFSVPKGIATGRYRLVLRNNYGSSFEGGMIQITN